MLEPLVIRHRDAAAWCAIKRARYADAELLSLTQNLKGNGERCEHQNPAGMTEHVLSPHKLHRRFAEPAIPEDRRTTAADRPLGQRGLEIKQEVRHPYGRASAVRARVRLR